MVVTALSEVESAPTFLELSSPDLFCSCVSDLQCAVGGIGALPLRGKPLSNPPLELFTCGCALFFHPFCELSDYIVVGTALSLTLTVVMLAIVPDVSQTLFSPGHQHRSTEVRSQNCSNHGSGPTVGTMRAAQSLASPNPHVYVPTKSTAANDRPVSAAGALIVCSDVL